MIKKTKDQFPNSEPAASSAGCPLKTRRRGEILENAILQAAWDELREIGYVRMTMEAVAERAKTNKASLYRRWPSKAKLVIAALHKYLPKPLNDIPNTGNLRDDMLSFLYAILRPLQIIGAETLHGLMIEHLGGEFFHSSTRIKHPGVEGKWNSAVMIILKNAEARGDIHLGKISPRVVSLPADLLRYELLVTHKPISDKTAAEIIDDIFLPLLTRCTKR